MAGIMDFFKAAPVQQQQQQPNNQQQQQQQQGTPPSNVGNPDIKNADGTNTVKNPLDIYKEMFDNNAKMTPTEAPSFNLADDVLTKVTDSMDFTQGVPKELMDKALTGDSAAIIELMGHTSKAAYRTALQHSSSLTDKFVGARSEFDLKKVRSNVKSELTNQELSSIPNATHPLVKQELNRIANEFEKANPDATPQEIVKATKEYWDVLHNSTQIQPTEDDKRKANGETDWSNYFAPTPQT